LKIYPLYTAQQYGGNLVIWKNTLSSLSRLAEHQMKFPPLANNFIFFTENKLLADDRIDRQPNFMCIRIIRSDVQPIQYVITGSGTLPMAFCRNTIHFKDAEINERDFLFRALHPLLF
jgi:hypothetical protein